MTEPSWPHDGTLHAWWVEPGRLLAGEYPGSDDQEKARAKVGLLIDAGVDTIVDLTTPADRLVPYDDHLAQVRRFSYPIPDMGVIDDAGYDEILAFIRSELDAQRTVYLHCWGGKGRTTTVIGCLLVDSGLDYDAATARIALLRTGTRKVQEPCPETQAQHDVLRRRSAG
ncbi:protein-tyrosine phosphatase family protein [soil metagenome]